MFGILIFFKHSIICYILLIHNVKLGRDWYHINSLWRLAGGVLGTVVFRLWWSKQECSGRSITLHELQTWTILHFTEQIFCMCQLPHFHRAQPFVLAEAVCTKLGFVPLKGTVLQVGQRRLPCCEAGQLQRWFELCQRETGKRQVEGWKQDRWNKEKSAAAVRQTLLWFIHLPTNGNA